MRIHKISIQNLNSLEGSFEIDLENRFAGAGLFLIHGPTGAGKTTILDAICLALYGMTPRLKGQRGGIVVEDGAADSSPFLVMTRGQVVASAGLEFSVAPLGEPERRYRAKWTIRRANKNPEGRFQYARRSLARLEPSGEWETLLDSERVADGRDAFAKVLGALSFEDFQRTTLLAQFAFREFLEAREEDRARILSSLTDGAVYRQIGARAAQARREANEALKEIDATLASQDLLSAEVLAQKKQRAQALEAALVALREAHDLRERQAQALKGHVQAQAKKVAAEEALAQLTREREEIQGALDALEAERRVAPAIAALREHEALAGRWSKYRAEGEEIAKRLSEAQVVLEPAQVAWGQAQAVQQEALAQLEAKRPEIAKARHAWEAERGARQHWLQATAQWQRRQRHAYEAQLQWREESLAFRRLIAAEEEAIAGVAAGPPLAALEAACPVLRQRYDQWAKAREGMRARKDEYDRGVARQAALEARRKDAQQKKDALEAELQRNLARQELLLERGEALSPGGSLRVKYEREAERGRALQAQREALLRARRLWEGWRTELEEATRLEERCAEARTKVQALEAKKGEVGQRVAALEEEVAHLLQALEQFKRLLALVEARDLLSEGAPCPVCGSDEHPYRVRPEQTRDAEELAAQASLERELGARRVALEAAQKGLGDVQQALTQAAAELGAQEGASRQAGATVARRESELEQAIQLLLDDEGPLALGAVPLELGAGGSDLGSGAGLRVAGVGAADLAGGLARWSDEVARVEAQVRQNLGQLKAWFEEGEGLEVARRGLLEQQKGVEAELTKAALEDEHLRGQLKAEWERLEGQGQEWLVEKAAIEGEIVALEGQVRQAGGEVPSAEVLAGRLGGRVAWLEGRYREALRLEAARAEAEAARMAGERALQPLEGAAVRAGEERAEAWRAWEVAYEAWRAAYGARGAYLDGVEPERVHERLEGALIQARQRAEAQREALAGLRGEVDRLVGQQAQNVRQLEALEAPMVAGEAALVEALSAHGLADIQALRALILEDAYRERWGQEEKRWNEASTRAEAVFAEAEVGVEAAEAALEGLEVRWEGEVGAYLEALQAEQREKGEAREAKTLELGAIKGELARHEAILREHAHLKERREEQQHLYARWEQIAELIGTNEGGAFEKIVQRMNLGVLIEHANRRLAHFMDRYALIQARDAKDNNPLLEFLVLDRLKEGGARSTRSLSGGESFIVSLALALGLADMRGAQSHQATLLIDEGFGALDIQTLQMLVVQLEALQAQQGAQIGIISHVEGLHELISAQIAVKPLGPGRSTLEMRG